MLLALLQSALTGSDAPTDPGGVDWQGLCAVAKRHAVLPLLCPLLGAYLPERAYRPAAERCAAQFYRLLILTRRCTELLRARGVEVLVLKGPGAAWYYPVPEHRKSGDIDLLLPQAGQLPLACEILTADGAQEEQEQHANHHRSFRLPEGMVLEVHTSLMEDFDAPGVNALAAAAQREMAGHTLVREILPGAALPVPDAPMQAVSQLLHMLQHFLRAGFGLKLLCDWTALWNGISPEEDMSRYARFVEESGLRTFDSVLRGVCGRYLGLRDAPADTDEALCVEFLREVFDAEEFGRTAAQRMVMVRGGLGGYLREFHHQMRLNYPRASRCPLLWPALWCATLLRFLRNNRAVRSTTLWAVLRETKRRSRLTEPLRLFEAEKVHKEKP